MKKYFLIAIIAVTVIIAFISVYFPKSSTENLSAYLVGSYVDSKDAKDKLTKAGFEVIASYKSVKKGTTIVFTNAALKKQGAMTGRAYASVLRLFVDKQEKMISFTNPVYFGKAFMQKDYDADVYEEQLNSINKAFTGLKGSVDSLSEDKLESFQFMTGMPNYEDVDTLGEGTNSELLAKAKKYKKGKLLVFELKLSDNSTLLGYDLGKRTKKFVKKIGRANAAILPYCVSIENGKATSLEAKYYIALSYPLLTMGTFTTIATVPGAIKKDLAKAFK